MTLLGTIQIANAQSEIDYSLDGIGKTLNKLNFTSSGLCLGNFHEGLAWVRVSKGVKNQFGTDDWYGYIDNKGNLVTPFIYQSDRNFSDGYACVRDDNSKYSVIDKQGNTVITLNKGERMGSFSEGLACIYKNDSVGYINKNGELVIPYFSAYRGDAFCGGLAPIEVTKRSTQYIDKNGNIIIPLKPHRCYGYKDGLFIIRPSNSDYGLMDTKGNIVVPEKYYSIDGLSEGLCVAVMRKEERSASGFSVKILSGFVDVINGTETIPPQYEKARPFSEGLAAVRMQDKWGYINKQGQLVIPYKYKEAYDFYETFAYVKTDVGYDIIDKQGNTIKSLPNFEYFGEQFCEGLAVIKLNGKWGYIDIYGNSTFNPKASSIPSIAASTNNHVSSNVSSITTNSSYPGGEGAMREFIYKTLRYPVIAEENGEQGKVVVGFTVEKDGSITNINIKKSVSEWLDKEAKRIVSNMPHWLPAKSGEINVKSEQTVEVLFRLQ